MITATVWLLITVSVGGEVMAASVLTTHPTQEACEATKQQLEEDGNKWYIPKYRCTKSEVILGAVK